MGATTRPGAYVPVSHGSVSAATLRGGGGSSGSMAGIGATSAGAATSGLQQQQQQQQHLQGLQQQQQQLQLGNGGVGPTDAADPVPEVQGVLISHAVQARTLPRKICFFILLRY